MFVVPWIYEKMINKTYLIIILACLSRVRYSSSDDDDDNTTPTPNHQKQIPEGFVPDSVNMVLAWYGINQDEGLLLSTKNRMAAKLIWENTFGRPHPILETVTQEAAQEPRPPRINRRLMAEKGSRWSKEQRNMQEVLWDTLKIGGSGVTVREVVGQGKRTTLLIHGGTYYYCPEDSIPNRKALEKPDYRFRAMCTDGKAAMIFNNNIDPCIDAENVLVEYSFSEGWVFCLGTGERDFPYFINGTIDCGMKKKILMTEFQKMCTIENNVVITLDYYGDKPRKEIMKNSTVCKSWNPCHLSYLWRFEPPAPGSEPDYPTTTMDPCLTTACPGCDANFTGNPGYLVDVDRYPDSPQPKASKERNDSTKEKSARRG